MMHRGLAQVPEKVCAMLGVTTYATHSTTPMLRVAAFVDHCRAATAAANRVGSRQRSNVSSGDNSGRLADSSSNGGSSAASGGDYSEGSQQLRPEPQRSPALAPRSRPSSPGLLRADSMVKGRNFRPLPMDPPAALRSERHRPAVGPRAMVVPPSSSFAQQETSASSSSTQRLLLRLHPHALHPRAVGPPAVEAASLPSLGQS